MRFCTIGVAVSLALFSASSYAQSNNLTQNQVASGHLNALTAQQKKSLEQLQQKLGQMEKQLSVKTAHNASLSRLSQRYDENRSGRLNITTDSAAPFNRFTDTTLIDELTKEKQIFGSHALVFGGYLEFDPQIWGGNYHSSTYSNNGTQVNITTVNLNALANINNWMSTYFNVEGDFTSSKNLEVKEALLVLGDLQKSPLYTAVGYSYLPFGMFEGGGPWSSSLLTDAFRAGTEPEWVAAYSKDGLNTNIAVFNTPVRSSNISDFVYSIYYNHKINKFNYALSAGYLYDIRGVSSDIGDAYNDGVLNGDRNDAFDLNGSLGYGIFSLSGEYAQTFGSAKLGGQSTGKLAAWDIAGHANTILWDKATSFILSYSQTRNMANIPTTLSGDILSAVTTPEGIRREWIASASREVMKNIYVSPEFMYGWLYDNAGETWAGTMDISVYF